MKLIVANVRRKPVTSGKSNQSVVGVSRLPFSISETLDAGTWQKLSEWSGIGHRDDLCKSPFMLLGSISLVLSHPIVCMVPSTKKGQLTSFSAIVRGNIPQLREKENILTLSQGEAIISLRECNSARCRHGLWKVQTPQFAQPPRHWCVNQDLGPRPFPGDNFSRCLGKIDKVLHN